MQTISNIEKEFKKNFGNGDGSIIVQTKVFNYFLTKFIRQLLKQVVPEEAQREDNFGDGFNACRSEVKYIIKKILT